MKYHLGAALVCSFVLIACHTTRATENQDELAKPGKLLFEDNFSRDDMAPKWRVGKGFFTLKDGVVTAAENPDDKHGAYACAKPAFEFKDIVAEYSVKLDGSRACHLMLNDSKYKESHAGHIIKATIMPGKVDLADWKFGQMRNDIYEKISDPATTPEEKKKLHDSIKDTTAAFKTDVDFSQWHRIRIELVGDELLLSVDGKPAGYLKSKGIDHATKNAFGFEIGGKSCDIKDVKVWEATANPDWSSHRDAVVAAIHK